MLTRSQVRAALRANTCHQFLEEAHFIMETLAHIMGYMVPVGALLQDMEQRMQDLLAEMGGLAIEEQHDAHIANAIWGETGQSQEG